MTDTPDTPETSDATGATLYDFWGNEISVWQRTPDLPSTSRSAIDQIGGNSHAQGRK